MDQLKLKYIISLVSDLGPKARADQEALTRAQEAVQRSVGKTTQELSRLERALGAVGRLGSAVAERQSRYLAKLAASWGGVANMADKAAGAMGAASRVGAGVVAAGFVADRLTKAPMEYSLRLAHMANTAYAGRDVAGRRDGKSTLDAAIRAALRTGGGSKDEAAGALDSMIASGVLPIDQAVKLLPAVMRTSTASGASPEQLAAIALRGMQSFDIKLDQVPEVLNMAMAAGQAGGFELRDMAKWLPQSMAMGRQSGLSGIEGMRRLLASMQASVITGGTKDEAGNNLVNLLGKINSADTAKDFKKLGYDLPSELARMRGKGVNSLDAFVSFVDEIASKDKQYAALKTKLARGGTTGEKAATMASMADILQGKAIGQVVQDRQALMALVAEMNNRGYVRNVMDQTRTNTGAMDTSFAVVSQESAFLKQQAVNEVSLAADTAFAKVAPAFDAAAEKSRDLAREFPAVTTAAVGAAGALSALAAVAGLGGLVGLLRGGAGVAAAGGAAAAAGVAGGAAVGAGGAAAGSTVAAGAGVAAARSAPGLLSRLGGGAVKGSGGLLGLASELFYTSERDMEVLRNGDRMRQGARGKGYQDPRLLGVATPNAAGDRAAAAAAIARVSLGEGQLQVSVKVTDERTTATTTVAKPMSLVRIDAGNTNPAGYGR